MTPAFAVAPAGYRLPDATELGTVRLQVADLDRSITYYENVIGLRVIQRAGRTATLGAADGARVLLELHEFPGATPVPHRGRLGLYHFAILLPDRASLARFVIHLSDVNERAGMSDHVVSEAIYLSDPDGLGIEVYADRPRDSWRMDGDAIAMATLPLDLNDLLPAAGDQPWTGAPAGTKIGHVHLYVSDLGEASTFFHEGLGLDRIVLAFPGALFMSAGGYHHHLGTNTWAARSPRALPGDARMLEWTVRVPSAGDVADVGASLAASGIETTDDEGDVVAVDPWGTRVRVTVR